MSKFYSLKVSRIIRETADTVSIEFEVPADLKNVFEYKQGQYLTFKYLSKGQEIRRSYSICSSPYANEKLKVAVKQVPEGVFSTYANTGLMEGHSLEVMPPMGNFYTELNAGNQKQYVAFAAGSGITPVLSIIKSILLVENKSTVHLVYGNKDTASTIFKSELDKLAEQYANFQLTYVFSRQGNNDTILEGRINAEKSASIINQCKLAHANEYFICGPEEMIISVSKTLEKLGVDKKKVHFELFTTPVNLGAGEPQTVSTFSGKSKVTVLMDGAETNFELESSGINILDASIEAGVDAPFSCKGAVCCTCKAKVLEGKAIMNMNYALSDEEVASGYILTCQAHPQSEKLVVDFDV